MRDWLRATAASPFHLLPSMGAEVRRASRRFTVFLPPLTQSWPTPLSCASCLNGAPPARVKTYAVRTNFEGLRGSNISDTAHLPGRCVGGWCGSCLEVWLVHLGLSWWCSDTTESLLTRTVCSRSTGVSAWLGNLPHRMRSGHSWRLLRRLAPSAWSRSMSTGRTFVGVEASFPRRQLLQSRRTSDVKCPSLSTFSTHGPPAPRLYFDMMARGRRSRVGVLRAVKCHARRAD